MRIVKIGVGVLAVLALAAGGAYLYYTAREMPPEMSEYSLDLRELRRLAGELPGDPPVRVRTELVAEAALPRAAVFAGESFSDHRMVHQSFQIQYADGTFLILDGAFDQAMHGEMDGGLPYRSIGWENVQSALGRAEMIFITHEHADHIQGIARHESPEALVGRLRLTVEQRESASRMEAVSMPQVLLDPEPLGYDAAVAVAPGVVLVKAPGHTPGSQLMYVRQADGRELLFIGDVAWHMDAIRNLHYRPRLVTDLYLGEDRQAVLHQFRRLHDLDRMHPEVQIVSSHDPQLRKALVTDGILVDGFE